MCDHFCPYCTRLGPSLYPGQLPPPPFDWKIAKRILAEQDRLKREPVQFT